MQADKNARTWLEISLVVNGELAEAVAEVLARYCRNGVALEQNVRHMDDLDSGTPDGPITVRAFLPASEGYGETQTKIKEALHYLGMIQPLPAPTFRLVPDQNWMEAWREHYHPIPIGGHLIVVPAWSNNRVPGRIAIKIDPGMAFGTGTHPSTQLCLEFIDALLGDAEETGGRSSSAAEQVGFIDIGCGSGILAIAALRIGNGRALGVDIDPEAIQNARENAKLNGVEARLALGVGSVEEILAGRFGATAAPLVTVNILAPVIVRLLAAGLARVLQPGGSMILAGILQSQAESVETAAANAGMRVLSRRQISEWVALRVTRQ